MKRGAEMRSGIAPQRRFENYYSLCLAKSLWCGRVGAMTSYALHPLPSWLLSAFDTSHLLLFDSPPTARLLLTLGSDEIGSADARPRSRLR
eukprot:3336049-Pleurochrysis_carterae.AAC.1